jgi:subtilisin family serine protease/PKD repeat protein
MRKTALLFAFIASMMLFTSSMTGPEKIDSVKSQLQAQSGQPGLTPQIWPGVIVIKFREGVSIRSFSEGFAVTGISSIDQKAVSFEATSLVKRFRHKPLPKDSRLPDISRIYKLTFPERFDPVQVATLFSKDPNVEYAEPEPVMHVREVPNDPMYAQQQHLPQIMAEQAWEIHKGENGQEEVKIAIVDTGVEWYHEDLADNVWENLGEDADGDGHTVEMTSNGLILDPGDLNGIDDDGNGFTDDLIGWDFYDAANSGDGSNPDPNEGNSVGFHGTHVAGIAAASTGNGTGIASISWNLKYMAIQADENNNLAWGWDGIIYAADMGADVISCSWGGLTTQYLQYVADLMAYANGSGSIVVVAAGNDNVDLFDSPSWYPGVIAVASVNGNDTKVAYSSYGLGVDVSAPGGGLEGGILSTMPGNTYDLGFGTSMATPLVSGLMGLVKSYHPGWTNDQVIAQVIATCDNIDPLNPFYENKLGSGRINAYQALANTGATPPQELKLDMTDYTVTDADGDFKLEPGEVVTISLKIRNYTHSVSTNAVNFTLSADDNQIEFNNATYIGTINSDSIFNFQDIFQFTISAGATSHVVALNLSVTADIQVISGDKFTIPVVIAPSGFFIYEKKENGRDYSGTYIRQYLEDRGFEYTYSNYLPKSLLGFATVFLSMGNLVYPRWDPGTFLTEEKVQILTNYLETGGKMYIEGGGVFVIPWWYSYWNYNLLRNMFGIQSVTYNWNSNYNPIDTLTGIAGTLGEGMEFSASSQYNNFYIDKITPKTGAICPFKEYGYGNVAVYNTGTFGQKTFFMAYSLADLKDIDTTSSRYYLLNKIMEYLGYPLLGNYLMANFTADVFAGSTSSEVHFKNISLQSGNAPLSAQWDFQNDGTIDSYEENPVFTFTEKGVYDVKMIISDGVNYDTILQKNFFTVNKGLLVYEAYEGCRDMSGAWIRDFLLDNDYVVTYVNEVPRHIDGYDAIFLSFGNQSSFYSTFENGCLNLVDNYLASKGKVYLEGGAAFGVDQNDPPAWNLFGLQNVISQLDPTASFDTIIGQAGSICEGMNYYGSNQVGQWFIDQYNPNNHGQAAFEQPGYAKVAVQHIGLHDEKTFCFSYCLAELQDGESTRGDLMWAILNFFDLVTGNKELEKPSGTLNLQVYPVPTDGMLTVSYYLPDKEIVKLEVYDLAGRKIFSGGAGFVVKGPNREFITLNCPAGIYLLKIQAGSTVEIRKLIKN